MQWLKWELSSLLIAAIVAWFWFSPLGGGAVLQEQVKKPSSAIAIEEFTLSNGMQVILLPNSRVPAVSHMLWLRVGAADDPLGKSGVAHYHEHLMFKGTPNVAAGEYSRQLESLGGEFNAFTGSDFTGYYVNIAAEHLEKVMQLESDRMRHLQPAPQDFAKELEVIVEERQTRVGNKPPAQWKEQMQAALFLHHPYRIPVIGWMHEIKGLTPQDATEFYRQHYHAGNMVLIVAGDITREQLALLAEKHYGDLPARSANERAWVQEPPAIAPRRVDFMHAEVKQPRFERRYLAPSYGSDDATLVMPLSLLSQWLGGGQTSLLYERLVQEKQLAVSVNAGYSGFSRGPAQFVISAIPTQGVSLETLEAAIDVILQEVVATQIQADDLTRIKTLYNASAIYARDSLSALAHYAGYLSMLNLPMQHLTQWEQLVNEVTAKHMQQAAAKLLQPEKSVTGYLLPKTTMQENAHD